MNKVVYVNADNLSLPQNGSIWKSPSNELFMLATVGYVDGKKCYTAVGLKDGNRWEEPRATTEEATKGLTLLFEKAEIAVEKLSE